MKSYWFVSYNFSNKKGQTGFGCVRLKLKGLFGFNIDKATDWIIKDGDGTNKVVILNWRRITKSQFLNVSSSEPASHKGE